MIRLVAGTPVERPVAESRPAVPTSDADPELLALRVEVQRLRLALSLSRAREERNRHLAFHDPLTGLPNRLDFDHQSNRAVARHDSGGRAFALLYIDLDGFKAINDLYGHDIGDELLKVIASRLSHAVRKGDSVSRHGGDEFACLLPSVANEAQATSIARKLQVAISAPNQIGPLVVSIRPSIGVALYPRDASTVASLLKAADQAMRWAKQERLGLAFFNQLPAAVSPTDRPKAGGQAPERVARVAPVAAVRAPSALPRVRVAHEQRAPGAE
jgi:diguanylate cyclase